MIKILIYVFLIFLIIVTAQIQQPSDYANAPSPKCLPMYAPPGSNATSGNTYTVNVTYSSDFPCYCDIRPEDDEPFAASIAYAVADTLTELQLSFDPSLKRETYRLNPQDFLDCYAYYIQEDITKQELARVDVSRALNYVRSFGILPYPSEDEEVLKNIVVTFPDQQRCNRNRAKAVFINGYYYIAPSQVKNLLRRFRLSPLILSLSLDTLGSTANPPIYPPTGSLTTPPDLFYKWEDKEEQDKRCDNSYNNNINQFQTPGYCPTFTYFSRMIGYSIQYGHGSPDLWNIYSCMYRRNTPTINTCNAFSRFTPYWQSTNQFTDTAYLTYGAYQPYIIDPCEADVDSTIFTLTDDEIDFMEREKLSYCDLFGIDTFTIHGYNDEEILMLAHIIQYNFYYNTKHFNTPETSGKWDLVHFHIHNDLDLYGKGLTTQAYMALNIIRPILKTALITADNFNVNDYMLPSFTQTNTNLRG
ncbi:hypothetical protein WA158_007133 [Blastocystis sp. Blastoise]